MSPANFPMVFQTRIAKTPRSRTRILTRSHHGRGLRVSRSSSRSRLLNSGAPCGTPALTSEPISSLLYGPRTQDLVDEALVELETLRQTLHLEEIEDVCARVEQADLCHAGHRICL